MIKNVGTSDAHMRIVVAAVLVLIALFGVAEHPYLRIVLALFGAVLAGTAYLRACWLYTLMGKNTCEPDTTAAPAAPQDVTSDDAKEASGEKIV